MADNFYANFTLNFTGTNSWTEQTLLFHHYQLQEE